MRKVLVFGTFDILHPGHLYFLREARKHGDHLTVVVTPSVAVKKLKTREPIFDEQHRIATVQLLSCVDRVILGDRKPGTYAAINDVQPDIVCIGHDQENLVPSLKKYFDARKLEPRFVHITAYNPKKYKSTTIKRNLSGKPCFRCQL